MKWNLRLAAANRGIWKASELQRLLAERSMVISAGKMSGLWSCLHCDTPIPAGSRRDRVYCTSNCSALASYYRRKNGAAPPPRWQHPALGSGDPALRAAAARARQLGQTHGWSPSTLRCTLDGLTVLLDGRPAGEPVTLTEICTRTPHHTSAARVAEVLAGHDLLEDDSIPAVRSWIERRAGGLPRGFADAVRAWLLVLLDGDARARPRSPPWTTSTCPTAASPSAGTASGSAS